MSKTTAFAGDFLKAIFHGTPIAGLLDNASTDALTNLQIALHTADPGVGGSQSTSEVNYTGYARVPVARSASGWTINANVCSPTNVIEFGEMTAGTPSVATHFSVGTAATGAGKILWRFPLTPNIDIKNGTVPRIRNNSTLTET